MDDMDIDEDLSYVKPLTPLVLGLHPPAANHQTRTASIEIHPPPLVHPTSSYVAFSEDELLALPPTNCRERTPSIAKIEIHPPPLVNPKSIYGEQPCPPERECVILTDFLKREGDLKEVANYEEDFIHYQLDDFTIYTSLESSRHPYEMIRLSALNILNSVSVVLVDGYLVNNGERRHVENLALCRVSVTYGDNPESHFQQPEIWVQSRDVAELGAWTQRKQVPPNTYQRALSKVWYTLGKPSVAYARYYNSFKWVVTLGIHFFDFLEARAGEGGTQSGFSAGAMTKFGEEPGDIVLLTFKEDFGNWLRQKAKKYSLLQSDDYHKKWLTEYGRSSPDIPDGPIDFRHAVAGHKDWLWNQLLEGGVEWAPRVRNFTLWREIHTLDAIPYAYPGRHIEDTVVTPYVHSVFKGLYGPYLKQVKPFSPHMGSAKEKSSRMIGCVIGSREYVPKLGDVVAFDSDKNTAWTADKDFANTGSLWYGWVTKIHEKTLDIVWLYSSKDTILFKGEYPWQNELFFSDHCNCHSDIPLLVTDILKTVNVVFCPRQGELPSTELFARQKYRTSDAAFLTLRASDLELGKCPCQALEEPEPGTFGKISQDHSVGDAILYSRPDSEFLEPGVIVDFHAKEEEITIRRLTRLDTIKKNCAPNEVIFTHYLEKASPSSIARRCFVRVFFKGEIIEPPYNRDGIGDCFFIRYTEYNGQLTPLDRNLADEELRQGFGIGDRTPHDAPVLRGMDLFCGGGSFGRGLEEGGAVEMKWAVDFDNGPLHSYRANLPNLKKTALYLGSINNYLKEAISGNHNKAGIIPEFGEVDFISAGSPCQGFSNANPDKTTEGSLRKQSLVCSLATAIDFYRPKYAVLENVREISTTRLDENGKPVNTFATMLCSIVGMGYQCQSFMCDAWSHGNCQSRTRLILCITKEGYKEMSRPPRSHPHRDGERSGRLYEGPSGEAFGCREVEGPCPFPFVSTKHGWGHLPNIGDGHVGIGIKYPDHMPLGSIDTAHRLMMANIPRFLPENSWRSAVEFGRLHSSLWVFSFEGERSKKGSNTFSRVSTNGLCRTITTRPSPRCSRTGRWVHSDHGRLITVQEARIAQGFPDEEVLVGTPTWRIHVVGNSVARGVSLALGIALREAYFGTDVFGL